MKKIMILLVGVVMLVDFPAHAGSSIYDRTYVSGGTNCIAIWTNGWSVSAVELTMLRVERSLTATNVVTFVRISAGSGTNNVYTNAIGAVTCAGGAGVQATLTAIGLKYGDIVKATGIDAATGSASNTFTAGFEYDVQQP